MMFTLDCDRAYLYAHPERELTVDEIARYDAALARRATGVPAQYITGHQEFWGMDLIVSPAVLIPRPETEHVVEAVLELVSSIEAKQDQDRSQNQDQRQNQDRSQNQDQCQNQDQYQKQDQNQNQLQDQRPRTGVSAPQGLRIVDVGTGSGAIALALARELPSAEITATDISEDALEIARANAARHELGSRIAFQRTDLLSGVTVGAFDFVVSNPPYVGESEEDSVQLEVRKFEPRGAVFAGPTGLEVIERLIPQAHAALRPGGWLVFEISGTIADSVRGLLAGWTGIAIKNDLQGIARVVMARKSATR